MDIIRNFLAVVSVVAPFLATVPAFGQASSSPIKLSTVVIDPGHGGKDAGCISPSGKTMEKTVVLSIASRLAEKIRTGYPDVNVIMTRTDDSFVELQGRADIANKAKANLFISIHVNSVDGKKSGPNGYSVHILGQYTSKKKDLYAGNMEVVRRENSVIMLEDDYTTKYEGFNPSDPESYIFMNLMQNSFLEQSFKFARFIDEEMKGGAFKASRGISQDPFYVLWRTAMPAVLVECGFMSNPSDREALISSAGKERIATDLYKAFVKYKKDYDGASAVAPVTPAIPEKAPEVEPKTEEPKPQVTEEPAESEAETKAETEVKVEEPVSDGVIYGIQVLASSKVMSPSDKYFMGHDMGSYKVNNLYKYVICRSSDLSQVKESFSTVKSSYPDSFIVKVENGAVTRVK
ncbi:MAG: N-acetylmuramoyl-L-alanine amidase [Bacteroidales bacterium]|nr:N-acetylmuramoyl-L-alanine amidase [Bacteroidales bacterium]